MIRQPGGDTIGRRRLDTHFAVFRELGAQLKIEHGFFREVRRRPVSSSPPRKGLQGAPHLPRRGFSNRNGKRAHCRCRSQRGHHHRQCRIRAPCPGALPVSGTVRRRHRRDRLESARRSRNRAACTPADHRIGGDYIEAGSFIGLAAATGSELTIQGVEAGHLRMIRYQFGRFGVGNRIAAGDAIVVRRGSG